MDTRSLISVCIVAMDYPAKPEPGLCLLSDRTFEAMTLSLVVTYCDSRRSSQQPIEDCSGLNSLLSGPSWVLWDTLKEESVPRMYRASIYRRREGLTDRPKHMHIVSGGDSTPTSATFAGQQLASPY